MSVSSEEADHDSLHDVEPLQPFATNLDDLQVSLPQLPRPSVSRSSSTTYYRTVSPRPSPSKGGLDMSVPPTRYQPRSATIGASVMGSGLAEEGMRSAKSSSGSDGMSAISAASLEEDIQRTRQARQQRDHARTQSSNANSLPASITGTANDPGETRSARENIMALAGTPTPASGAVASLASFMGGGAKPPPLHRVNTEMTPDEREITDKLEKQMHAIKSKWGGVTDADIKPKGLSLAELMSGKPAGDSKVGGNVAQRWQPSATKANSAPAFTSPAPSSTSSAEPTLPRPQYTASPAGSYSTMPKPTAPAASSQPQPLSLAAALGSRSSGPRLNQPVAQHHTEEGPAHGRSLAGIVAMPGMVKTPTAVETPPIVVEAKIVSRSPPPLLDEARTSPPADVEAQIFSRPAPTIISASPDGASEPVPVSQSPRKNFGAREAFEGRNVLGSAKMAPTPSLTRLQSSNIVADRLKWGEEQRTSSTDGAESPVKASANPKRRSVMERWGRDAPDAMEPSISPVKKTALPPPSDGPALVHLSRAAPPRSHSRTLPSPPAIANLEPPAPVDDAPSSSIRTDPSPRFDSPPMDSSTWNEIPMSREPSSQAQTPIPTPAVTRGWSGPPIGVKEPSRQSSWVTREDTEVPSPKYSRGVAMPGMSAAPKPEEPTMSKLVASQFEPTRGLGSVETSSRYKEPQVPTARQLATSMTERPKSMVFPAESNSNPRPVTPPPRLRTTSMHSGRRTDDPPRSPGGSVLSKIAAWGTGAGGATHIKFASRAASIDWSAKPPPVIEAPPPKPIFASRPPPLTSRTSSSRMPMYRPRVGEVARLLRNPQSPLFAGDDASFVSAEIIDLATGSPLDTAGVIYETEALAIVYKRKTSTLPTTSLLIWKGRRSEVDPAKAQQVIDKLTKSHRVEPVHVQAGSEPPEFLQSFGGPLTICLGTRAHFEPEQSRLYRVEASGPSFVIEERNLASASLCSGFVFLIALMGDVYVWIGKGATMPERHIAQMAATKLAAGRPVTSVEEGSEPHHLWHALGGEGSYASANYWRFRRSETLPNNVVALAIDTTSDPPITRQTSTGVHHSMISLIDAGYEQIIVVPDGSAEKMGDLSVALDAAEEIASLWKARQLPYRPPVHVIAFPSIIPRDFLHLSRALDWDALNVRKPSSMNVYTVEEAKDKFLSAQI